MVEQSTTISANRLATLKYKYKIYKILNILYDELIRNLLPDNDED